MSERNDQRASAKDRRGECETDLPTGWVGRLGCYNDGRLTGDWFDALDCPQERPEFEAAMTRRIAPGERLHRGYVGEIHEGLWVFDHERFVGLLTGECSPADAAPLGQLVADLSRDGYPVAAYAFYCDNVGQDYATLDEFRDVYCGEYDTEAEFARQLADDFTTYTAAGQPVPWPLTCIDWEQAWRELHCGGDNYSASAPGGVYILRSA